MTAISTLPLPEDNFPAGKNTNNLLALELTYIPSLNLVLQQNNHPIVQALKLSNFGNENFRNLRCVVSSAPAIFPETMIHVSAVDAGESVIVDNPSIPLNYHFLSTLSDTISGTLFVKIFSENGAELLSRHFPLTAYAPDQWLGSNTMPELLAAFVTPNLEVVAEILSKTASELERATGSASIQGYQADKKRVYEICAAVYRAIHTVGIRYSNPPASFANPGQRIRFADTVCHHRLGTCLDLSLLFASVLEQAQLHPVVLLTKNHAYVGCHLREHYFPDIPTDDLQMIRKLVDLDEFVVWECTAVCGNTTFSETEAIARKSQLNADDEFEFAVDIVRARNSGIRPLPILRSAGGLELGETPPPPNALPYEFRRELRDGVDFSELAASAPAAGRIRRWQQKLLDLSLRNRLLNVRETRQVIPLVCSDITKLEDKMAIRRELSLKPISNLLGEKDVHDLAQLREKAMSSELRTLLERELEQKRLWAGLSEDELQRRLKAIYRQSRTDLDESGVNTLFLGIGFLEWKVDPSDTGTRLAPLLLVPIRLTRRSIADGITISRLDEDTLLNVTLTELLRQDYRLEIPGLNPLPTDENGVDVAGVLQIFRQAILPMKGWEVREDARIGLFSFGKFIMWNDLVNRTESLRAHPIVNHLIEGGGFFDDGIEVFPPEAVGENIEPAKLFCPMNADSSQLTAVRYSELGKNFVLHGPPGTGKSQTITNIIAHNLALGKRVLFVSEKKAALDVVHRRLCSIGLRPFCLELHSNKAGKTEVMKQFADALAVAEKREPKDWDTTVANLEHSRESLNAYVASLHKIYPNGLSADDCFSRIFKAGKDGLCAFNLEIDCLTHSREDFDRLNPLGDELVSAFSATTQASRDTFSLLAPADWSPGFEKNLCIVARDTAKAAENYASELRALIAEFCSEPAEALKPEELDAFLQIAKCLRTPKPVPATLLTENFPQDEKFLREIRIECDRLNHLKKALSAFNTEQLPQLDCDNLEKRIRKIKEQFFLTRFFSTSALLKELDGIRRIGSPKLTLEILENSLDDIREFCQRKARCDIASSRAKALLAFLWSDAATDWEQVSATLDAAKTILDALRRIAPAGTQRYDEIRGKLAAILPVAESRFAAGSPAQKNLERLEKSRADYAQSKQTFAETFSPQLKDAQMPPETLAKKIRRMLEAIPDLRRSLLYLKSKYNAETAGLHPAVSALESASLLPASFKATVELAYRQTMLEQVLSSDSVLSGFVGERRNAEIRRFCELDDRYIALSREIIFARLAARLPKAQDSKSPVAREIGLLKRECEKRSRLKPIRQLLEQIPSIVPALKPCFLMSPLSVAQYLSADCASFDLVIFDEASQIPVWDAIGAVARGKQLIVVGDPKQMPPTNFFQRSQSRDEAEPEDDAIFPEEDLESILDECLAAGLFPTHLNWHYRSRHESLIAFSNHHYYEDRLMTFPSASNDATRGIRFEFVENGIYDRCGKRTNTAEAERLVRYVFERLADPDLREKSIGIVTFSQPQKDLIEDILERERAAHPEFEPYFNEERPEALFVKNLENVQGDERDIILFSVGYACDAKGNMSMNFGPLNRQGGERRLNVAVTRAKEQVVVFSSVHGHQIDLTRTRAVGAAHLRYFLEHAEKGTTLLSREQDFSATNSGLADTVAAFLKAEGYAVKRNVGCSGTRIDVAVLRPGSQDTYLLGIECDGKAYRRQHTVRDRDHLRADVLKSLGWTIFRAWTMDWAFDRKQAERALLEAIADAESKLPKPSTTDCEIVEDTAVTVIPASEGMLPATRCPAGIPVF